MPNYQFDRDDLIRGINTVIAKLRAAGESADIRIVGGAALALRYFDRPTTTDIDAQLHPEESILRAATAVAEEEGWPTTGSTTTRPCSYHSLAWAPSGKFSTLTRTLMWK